MKNIRRFLCKECGYISHTWIGKCPGCNSWNSFDEEKIEKNNISHKNNKINVQKIDEINDIEHLIIKTDCNEIDDFFGEGIVQGSVILLSGEPGIGKSTFLLNLSDFFKNEKILYISGEETINQIKKRSDRININNNNLYISDEIEIESILLYCKKKLPDIIFIDSIQVMYSSEIDSAGGSVSQVKYCTNKLIEFAKEKKIVIFIIGHITKTGDIAGPKILEHMVDVVIYFEGDNQYQFRILRIIKNRFGSIDEILLFEMGEKGLNLIKEPSLFFIDKEKDEDTIGKCKTIIVEGKRAIIVDVEALVVPSVYSNARRFSEGIDIARLSRIAAILDKYENENLNNYDIYFNISGGIKTKDIGIDLAIAISIYSSKNKKKVSNNFIFLGELSLTGKIKNIFKIENRIKEALRYGNHEIFIPENKKVNSSKNIICIDNINSAIKHVFK